MTSAQWSRLKQASILFVGAACIAVLLFIAFEQKLDLFYTPAQAIEAQPVHEFRLGGVVDTGSIVHGDGLSVRFVVKDDKTKLDVDYSGILPDLFREEQTIIAVGKLDGERFVARQILAKHDENYKPRVLA